MNLLDFEKPIAELEAKLNDMKQLAKDSDTDVQAAIKALERKILELKKETFENLTGWPRSSASSPGYAPGVSINVTMGLLNFSAIFINRRAFR